MMLISNNNNSNPYTNNLQTSSFFLKKFKIFSCGILSLLLYTYSCWVVHPILHRHTSKVRNWKEKKMNEARVLQWNRSQERRKRVQPVIIADEPHFLTLKLGGTTNPLEWIDEKYVTDETRVKSYNNTDKFCGDFVQIAANLNPSVFSGEDKDNDIDASLNSNSRVFITNILSPLGINLALKLKYVCGVKEITGADSMQPNTIHSRFEFTRRLKVLIQEFPFLNRHPIITTYIGLAAHKGKHGYDILRKIKPTHVIHLGAIDGVITNQNSNLGGLSPYGEHPPFNLLRQQALVSEQIMISILESRQIKRFPKIIFISTYNIHESMKVNEEVFAPLSSISDLHSSSLLSDEVILSTYSQLFQIGSICIRIPTLYGTWLRNESQLYRLTKSVIMGDYVDENVRNMMNSSQSIDFLFVDDAVDIIIASMQIRNNNESISINAASSESTLTYKELLQQMLDLFPHSFTSTLKISNISNTEQTLQIQTIKTTRASALLNWKASVSMKIGVEHMLNWIYNDVFPYGKVTQKNGKDEVKSDFGWMGTIGKALCDPYDSNCLAGKTAFMCASECSLHSSCKNSSYDRLLPTSYEYTEKCDLVMYTFVLEKDIDTLPLSIGESSMDDVDKDGRRACKIAYVSKQSKLVGNMLYYATNNDLDSLYAISQADKMKLKFLHSLGDSQLCLDLPGYHTSNGNKVKLYGCNGGDNQSWQIDNVGRIRSSYDKSVCIDIAGTKGEIGAGIIIWECNDSSRTQIWEITPENRVRSVAFPDMYVTSSKCLLRTASTVELKMFEAEGDCALAQKWFVPSRVTSSNGGSLLENVPNKSYDDETYDLFNTKLVQKGWTLIWYKSSSSSRSSRSLFGKLSPGKLFAPSVEYAMYIDSHNLKSTPVVDDLFFMADMASREKLPERRKSYTYKNGKKSWFDLVAEPSRQAILIASPMNIPIHSDDGKLFKSDIVSRMVDDLGGKYTKDLSFQQDFYDKAISLVNKGLMRSQSEPLYVFDMHHWVQSRWLLHDMKSEEARNFRCDWYSEQVEWDSDLDPLGFAYIMAKREMYRKFGKHEPDNRIKVVSVDRPEINELSDKNEWFELMNINKGWIANNILESQTEDTKNRETEILNYFVRMFQSKNMWNSRRDWNRKREGALILRKFQ